MHRREPGCHHRPRSQGLRRCIPVLRCDRPRDPGRRNRCARPRRTQRPDSIVRRLGTQQWPRAAHQAKAAATLFGRLRPQQRASTSAGMINRSARVHSGTLASLASSECNPGISTGNEHHAVPSSPAAPQIPERAETCSIAAQNYGASAQQR